MDDKKSLHGETTVAWVDTDASGRIHFTAPFRWVEAVEHAAYRDAGLGEQISALPRLKVGATYHRPLSAGDHISIELRPVHLGKTSVGYEWQIFHQGEAAIAGHHTAVHVGADGIPAPLPETLRALLSELPRT